MLYRLGTLFGVTGTVSQEETFELQLIEVVVPRYANDLNTTFDETANDVCLDATIDQDHLLWCRV